MGTCAHLLRAAGKACRGGLRLEAHHRLHHVKRLCDRALFANANGTVTVLMTRDEFQAAQGEQFIDEIFDGSLPRFLAAFSRRKK